MQLAELLRTNDLGDHLLAAYWHKLGGLNSLALLVPSYELQKFIRVLFTLVADEAL
jgi:hypothetical protein